ncbi:hypothetical protein EDD85DRAFT_857457 [Armillaria nabsnona]|nr:hypothetical protein EDD85DRAFT_857457 [Armillaria nabsnona]
MSEKETNPCLLADDWSGLPVVGAPLKVIRLPGTHFTTFPTPHLGRRLLMDVRIWMNFECAAIS